jgi:hypothetical protein
MISEKAVELWTFIQKLIEANWAKTFGKRIYWQDFPEKVTINATKYLNILDSESIIMLFDDSRGGSGKEGMAFTEWGVRYNSSLNTWQVSWNDLAEKYTIVRTKVDGLLGVKYDAISLQAKPGDDLVVNKAIFLPMTEINYDILVRILNKSCQIFTGKSADMTDMSIEKAQPAVTETPIQPESVQTVDKNLEEPISVQKTPNERECGRSSHDFSKTRDFLETHLSGEAGSFLSENLGGVILSAALFLIFEVMI